MTTETHKLHHIPNQLRWNPFDLDEKVDWVHGLHLVAGAGDPTLKQGLGILLYAAGKDMGKEAFYSADGDFLIVPQHGVLDIQTELGRIILRPNEICVIPRGVRLACFFSFSLFDSPIDLSSVTESLCQLARCAVIYANSIRVIINYPN